MPPSEETESQRETRHEFQYLSSFLDRPRLSSSGGHYDAILAIYYNAGGDRRHRVACLPSPVSPRTTSKFRPTPWRFSAGANTSLPDGRIVGYRMVRGGAAFRWPLLEQVDYLSLNVFTIPLEIKRAYTLKGVPISVKAVANVKIKGDDMSLAAAGGALPGHDPRHHPDR